MKVLHLCSFYPEFGGPFTVVKSLLNKLQEKGIKVLLISPLPRNYNTKRLVFLNNLKFEVIYVRQSLLSYIWPSFSIDFFRIIHNIAKDYDIIHLHGLFDMYSIPVFLIKKKYIITLHGIFMREAYQRFFHKRLKKNLYMSLLGKHVLRSAVKIHVLTEEERIHFLDFYPEFIDKLQVIPNGINLKEFCMMDDTGELKKMQATLKVKNILFLGRLKWIKGLDILLEAFYLLLQERKNLHLIIAGKGDGDGYEWKIRNLIKNYGIEDKVTFAGFLQGKEKIATFKKSDVFVLPSYSEGLPTAVLEAMASGLPVVVSDRVGIVREISEFNAGIVIEPTVEGIYRGLVKWLDMEKSEVEAMKERAKQMVFELFDIDKTTAKIITLYEDILK